MVFMQLSIDLNEADAALFQKYADERNMTVAEAMLQSMRKAAHNAAYLAMIDRGIKQMKDGTGRFFSDEELEAFINGNHV